MPPVRLLSLSLLLLLLSAPSAALAKDGDRSVMGDLTSKFFYVGGGPGLTAYSNVGAFGGRFALGGGFYTLGFTAFGGMEITGNAAVPFSIHGVGNFGVAIPIPVFHPMFGFKVGGGVSHRNPIVPAPELTLGAFLGFIIRKFDGKPGFRFNVEPAYLLSADYGGAFETYFTFALVL
jgi:hypothetical protein